MGILGSVLAGAVLPVGVALALSGLSSPSARCVPSPRTPASEQADWTVLGVGFVGSERGHRGGRRGMIGILGAPHRTQQHSRSFTAPFVHGAARCRDRWSAAVRRSGRVLHSRRTLWPDGRTLPLGPRRRRHRHGRRDVDVLTSGPASTALVSHPDLYGWNWVCTVCGAPTGYGPVPNRAVAALGREPEVTSYSGVSFVTMQLDGVEEPILLSEPRAPRWRHPCSRATDWTGRTRSSWAGRGDAGAAPQADRWRQLLLQYAAGYPRRPIPSRSSAWATMPAIGIAEGLHTSMGGRCSRRRWTPAGVTEQLGPEGYGGVCNGPNMVLVSVRGGLGIVAGQAAAQRLSDAANRILSVQPHNSNSGGNVAKVLGVQRPAQIVKYRSIGTTPLLLAGSTGSPRQLSPSGWRCATSVRRCRRDLAQLKVLGFLQRQLSAGRGVACVAGGRAARNRGRRSRSASCSAAGCGSSSPSRSGGACPTVPVLSVIERGGRRLGAGRTRQRCSLGWRAAHTATALAPCARSDGARRSTGRVAGSTGTVASVRRCSSRGRRPALQDVFGAASLSPRSTPGA